jgi:hypothetical protein
VGSGWWGLWFFGDEGAGLDPVGDGGDVGVGEFGFGRHGWGIGLGMFAADEGDEERLLGVAGNEDGTVVATGEDAGAGVERESAAVVAVGVAVVAVGAEDGFDLLGVEAGGGLRGWSGGRSGAAGGESDDSGGGGGEGDGEPAQPGAVSGGGGCGWPGRHFGGVLGGGLRVGCVAFRAGRTLPM